MATIADRLIGCGAVKFGEFTLTSGATSNYYVDVKSAMTDPDTLRAIGKEMAVLAKGFDAVAGMELGAVPIATAVSLAANIPLIMVRKGERAHGTGKRIEGPLREGMKVFVVEDVTTSGGSTVEAIRVLRAAGAIVTDASVVVDRESGGREALAAENTQLHPLASASSLLQTPEAKAALAQ
jgi:orotate phosphoribosyltransferase